MGKANRNEYSCDFVDEYADKADVAVAASMLPLARSYYVVVVIVSLLALFVCIFTYEEPVITRVKIHC